MKKYSRYLLGLLVVAVLLFAVLSYTLHAGTAVIDEANFVDRPARIHPDYANTTIPPNIAPLNFLVAEPGSRYYVKIYSRENKGIDIHSRKPQIVIPLRRWKKLLGDNRGNPLYFDVYVLDEAGRWSRFKTITNTIADAGIDRYLVYRKIKLCVTWKDMGVYQRNLANYDESVVLHNSAFGYGCIHCHSFLDNNPDNMLMQVRSRQHGTPMLMAQNGKVTPLNVQTKVTPGKAGFTAWHPNGRIIAFSINKYSMLYHSAGQEVRDVFDHASDLALYLVDSNKVISTSKITKPDRMETFPEWSRDGRYLYFCSTPQLLVKRFSEVRCNLMRISYDCETRKWGDLEMVISADQVNGSITQPRFSPDDGRFILFNVSEYSDFPIHQAKCDLYIMDGKTGEHRKLAISSERNDSWHSWSSNGRWIAFTSKRLNGRFTRPFFSYIDETGKAHKPFVMPQKDPAFYDSLVQVYNIPELIKEPIRAKSKQLSKAIFAYKYAAHADAITGATPGLGTEPNRPPEPESPWLQP